MQDQDIRLSEQFLDYFIRQFTNPGEVVFDPFAGFGTTLVSAEKLGRVGFGIEVNEEWHAHATGLLNHPENLLLGDTRKLELTAVPEFALSISSPIYMHKHERLNPLSGFSDPCSYGSYLSELSAIYSKVASRMSEGGHLLIEAANLKGPSCVTTFAWDLCNEVSSVLNFQGEIVINWEQYGYGYDHSYCLVFTA